jgi:hypothetical protein
MEKHKNKRKIREEKIYSTTNGKVTEISLSINQKGNIEFDTKMINIYSETTYDRLKGEKVLSRVPLEEIAQFEINTAIDNNFDIIFAIDTNTRFIKGYAISVSGVIQSQKVFAVDPGGIASKFWQYWTPFCMEFIEIKSKPENLGWMMLIEHLNFKLKNIMKKRIGIIIDSDLGNLNEYNLRARPIYGEFLVPENIKLIYASSDGGAEFFGNKMLRLADKASKTCLNELESGRIPLNNARIEGKPYAGFRRLIPKK